MIGIMWFRFDLRLRDNPALLAAIEDCEKIIPVFIYDEDEDNPFIPGKAQQWWLSKSLQSLQKSLENCGGTLIIRSGDPVEELKKIITESGATKIFCNKCYEPYLVSRDEIIEKKLDVEFYSYQSYLLTDPEKIKNKTGSEYKVYTPYWKACLQIIQTRRLYKLPKKIVVKNIKSEGIKKVDNENYAKFWSPGEDGADEKLHEFLETGLSDYARDRDVPSAYGTSNLSPHLHFGEISPMQVWSAVEGYANTHRVNQKGVDVFLSQLGWREFSYYLLHYYPDLPTKNFNKKFDNFTWLNDKNLLKAWQEGRTGYPIVDAGMRELAVSGTMHNRVRMLVASFLTKDLLIHWVDGEKWFWDHLMDADVANNAASWQWVAGSGADAAPYFRIFNPELQAKKFDPRGEYINTWLNEVELINPIVDHSVARDRALDIYNNLKKES